MKTYYDVLQLLKQYGTYIHVGKRLWDIELAAVEIDRLHQASLIDDKTYATAKIVLRHAHEQEQKQPLIHFDGGKIDD
ncbi:YqgQ family protein [Lacticaseibacillus daqingensis]|uniref:YqgQ family protein n=1 Tax=Lacticaseibacillus daqingensis TaxID=2486014 RepID=UPI000F7B7555|nr:YqgQ family protein [Lacticaseibacillus daqingensis]